MAFSEDKKKAIALVMDVMNTLDPSGKNVKLYEEKFKNMTDTEFIKYCKNGGPLRLYIEAFDNEPKYDDIMKLCDKLGCPMMEYVTLPHIYKDGDDELISDKKVMVGPVTFKVLQQMATKESASTSDVKTRDKYNQVTGEDKAAMMSDQDVVALAAQGYDSTITEMLTFRSDNDGGKQDAYNEILNTGTCHIPDSIKDPKNKKSLQILDMFYRIAQIETNLIRDLEE